MAMKNEANTQSEENFQSTPEQFDRICLEHERKFRTLCRCVCRALLIIAIAYMAVYFKNSNLLFWWIIPGLFMNGIIENYITKDDEQPSEKK